MKNICLHDILKPCRNGIFKKNPTGFIFPVWYIYFIQEFISNRGFPIGNEDFLSDFNIPCLDFFQILLEFKFLFGFFFILLWNSQHPIGKLFFFHWKNDFLVETHSLKGIILLDGLGFCFITKVVIAMVYHITYWNF